MQKFTTFVLLGCILGIWFPSTVFGEFSLIGKKSGRCMAIGGGSVVNGGAAVSWNCESFSGHFMIDNIPVDNINNLPGETYYQLKFKHSGKCLGVGGISTANGATVVQWDCIPATQNLMFTYVPAPNNPGYFMIKARHSGKCLAVSGFDATIGAAIIQWDCDTQPHFLWQLTQAMVTYFSADPTQFNNYLTLLMKP